MATLFKFPNTLAADITFFNGESVSPTKLNNIFLYIKAALYSIEMYLGNGIDYSTSILTDKKVMANIASTIGTAAGNIYIPYNLFLSMEYIYKNYTSVYGRYGTVSSLTKESGSLDYSDWSLSVNSDINIPIMRRFNSNGVIGIHFTTNNNDVSCNVIKISETEVNTTVNLISGQLPTIAKNSPNNVLIHKSVFISAGEFISHIEIKNTSNSIYKIYSLYCSENIDGKQFINTKWKSCNDVSACLPYNNMYAIGLDHTKLSDNNVKSYCVVKNPCKWSSTVLNNSNSICTAVLAESELTGNCIGNTYDIYIDSNTIINKVGSPVCAGLYSENVDSTLVPRLSGTGSTISYNTDYDLGYTPNYKIVQSPLVIYPNRTSLLRFHPIMFIKPSIFGGPINGDKVELGRAYLYDVDTTVGTQSIFYNISMFATGRPDILRIEGSIQEDSGMKYILLSSEVGLSDMTRASMYIKAISSIRNISVYAD